MIILMGCSSTNTIYEDTIYITRKYIGDFISQHTIAEGRIFKRDVTVIITDQAIVKTFGRPKIEIPYGARCYLRYIAEILPPHSRVWVLYLTWDGTEDLYKLWQDPYTGRVF